MAAAGYGGGGGRGGGGYGSGYGSGYGGGAYGGSEEEEEPKGPTEDPLLTEARRELKFRLGCVTKGVAQVRKLSPKDRGAADLDELIKQLLTSIDQEELDINDFRDSVESLAADLADTYDIETEEESAVGPLLSSPAEAVPPAGNPPAAVPPAAGGPAAAAPAAGGPAVAPPAAVPPAAAPGA